MKTFKELKKIIKNTNFFTISNSKINFLSEELKNFESNKLFQLIDLIIETSEKYGITYFSNKADDNIRKIVGIKNLENYFDFFDNVGDFSEVSKTENENNIYTEKISNYMKHIKFFNESLSEDRKKLGISDEEVSKKAQEIYNNKKKSDPESPENDWKLAEEELIKSNNFGNVIKLFKKLENFFKELNPKFIIGNYSYPNQLECKLEIEIMRQSTYRNEQDGTKNKYGVITIKYFDKKYRDDNNCIIRMYAGYEDSHAEYPFLAEFLILELGLKEINKKEFIFDTTHIKYLLWGDLNVHDYVIFRNEKLSKIMKNRIYSK